MHNERGLSIPDIETLRKLSQIFNVSTDDVLSAKEKAENEGQKKIKINIYICIVIILLCVFLLMYNISTIISNFNIEYIFIMYMIMYITILIFIKSNSNKEINKKIILFSTCIYTISMIAYVFYTGLSYKSNNIKLDNFEINLIPLIAVYKSITLVIKKFNQ